MKHLTLSSRTLVADLLAASPLVAPAFIELRVDCIGCSMNKFCTLQDLCNHYNFELQTLIAKIQERLIENESN